MNFQNVFSQIIILFLLLISGYCAKKLKVFNDETIKGLTSILVNLSLPALVISSLIREITPSLLKESFQILIISFITYFVSFFIALIIPKIIRSKKEEIGVFSFIIMFSNVGFMGYPVLNAVFGEDSLFYAAIYNLPFNVLIFTIGIWLLKKDSNSKINFNWKLFINPGIIAVIIGFIIFVFSIPVPYIIKGTLDLLGSTTTPLSMIVVGGLLTHSKLKDTFSNWRIYFISFIRLIIMPLIIWSILAPFINHPLLLGIPVIIASMPAAANTAILAEEYGANGEIASQAIFISTLISIVTIPFIALIIT
ncbi:AEC family transporter [Defluviitalea phaphyphila]|uniref:AEC family transporter n=1 Tax=Defluviitalea phaphyphila TaxID=1473580 RepID=UPI000730AE5A|nr:AEC family transporter [Defluviitalea phaphyphila]